MPSIQELMGKDEESGETTPDDESKEGDHEEMGAASMKAMFDAMRMGDFKSAYQHFCDASAHESKSPGLALLIGKEKPSQDDY